MSDLRVDVDGILDARSMAPPTRLPGGFTLEEAARPPLSIFQQRLPVDDGQLHLLCPAGVGDNLWIVSKLWRLVEQRKVTFWLPDNEQKRSGDLFRMLGYRHGFMPGLSTDLVWSRPGSPSIPDSGAILSVQPNKHLENGHRIEKWYPEYEFRNPVELFQHAPPVLYKQAAGDLKYCAVFMCSEGYMEDGGNLHPGTWARILRQIERDIAPVVLIGAGKDVEFAEKVLKFFDPTVAPVFNAPLETVTEALRGAEMVVGLASGITILATYLGRPTMHAYPRWLAPMVGTWEQPGAVYGACFVDELENTVREGIRFTGATEGERMVAEIQPRLKVHLPIAMESQDDQSEAEAVSVRNGRRDLAAAGIAASTH